MAEDTGCVRSAGPLPRTGESALTYGRSETAWALKRDWTDHEFQAGAEANAALLKGFEDALVASLQRSCARALGAQHTVLDSKATVVGDVLARVLEPVTACTCEPAESVRVAVLNDPEVLGSALDMVGAYLKNYEVDKAASVVETVLPVCRQRGGLWLLKALNHLATVRMKQARPAEALEALREVEDRAAVGLSAKEEDEAWEFRETISRNLGWALSSLDREEEAIAYIQRAIDVKEQVGRPASWFDLWDLGRMKAAAALRRGEPECIRTSQAVVKKALALHQKAEPDDLVMRAKLWHSVGECSFALGHLAEGGGEAATENANGCAATVEAKGHYRKALTCFRQSHKLFRKTEGQHNPLTGGEAQAVAWALLKLGEDEEAKGFLLDVLEALSRQQSGWGDGACAEQKAPALLQAMQAVDRVLEAHRRTDDRDSLSGYFPAVERLCKNVRARLSLTRGRADAAVYERLISSASMIMIASGRPEAISRGQELLGSNLWERPETAQARICTEMLRALPAAETGQDPTAAVPLARLATPAGLRS